MKNFYKKLEKSLIAGGTAGILTFSPVAIGYKNGAITPHYTEAEAAWYNPLTWFSKEQKPEGPEAGDKYFVEKVVLDGGKDILCNNPKTGFYLLTVRKVDVDKNPKTVKSRGKDERNIDQQTSVNNPTYKQAIIVEVPYKLLILGDNQPFEKLKKGGNNIQAGKIIEIKRNALDSYIGKRDGVKRFVYPIDGVEIDALELWENVPGSDGERLPEDLKKALGQ
jgi:hypothetical protein